MPDPIAGNSPPHPSPQSDSVLEASALRTIVDSAMDAIVTIDERGTVVMFNAAAEGVFGVSASEAVGGTLERFIPGATRADHFRLVERFGATGVTSRAMGRLGTITGLRSDGTEFPMEASISQATVGDRRYYSAILRDITDRTRLEAQLLQAQKMECVGRLAGGIAHDFNNLLMAIFNYLSLATRRLGADHPVSPSLVQAHQAAQRAADLTRQLLTFSRKQVAAPRSVSIGEVVSGLGPMLERLIGEDVELTTRLAPATGSVRADAAQLEQVIVNLVVNARDAMPDGGSITITTSNESLDQAYCAAHPGATPGEHVIVAVADTGVGMAPEVLARIFEPFFTTKPAGKGTGLGLATCDGIVKLYGGHIAVESQPGRGTVVRVCLPRLGAHDSRAGGDHALRREDLAGSGTILLAEDSGLVRELVAEELRTCGYTVLTAASGAEALNIARSHQGRIDVLLTDVVMPGMSGPQLARELHAIRPVPVVYMSGHADEVLARHAVDPDRVPFVTKPVSTEALLLAIKGTRSRDGRR